MDPGDEEDEDEDDDEGEDDEAEDDEDEDDEDEDNEGDDDERDKVQSRDQASRAGECQAEGEAEQGVDGEGGGAGGEHHQHDRTCAWQQRIQSSVEHGTICK